MLIVFYSGHSRTTQSFFFLLRSQMHNRCGIFKGHAKSKDDLKFGVLSNSKSYTDLWVLKSLWLVRQSKAVLIFDQHRNVLVFFHLLVLLSQWQRINNDPSSNNYINLNYFCVWLCVKYFVLTWCLHCLFQSSKITFFN